MPHRWCPGSALSRTLCQTRTAESAIHSRPPKTSPSPSTTSTNQPARSRSPRAMHRARSVPMPVAPPHCSLTSEHLSIAIPFLRDRTSVAASFRSHRRSSPAGQAPCNHRPLETPGIPNEPSPISGHSAAPPAEIIKLPNDPSPNSGQSVWPTRNRAIPNEPRKFLKTMDRTFEGTPRQYSWIAPRPRCRSAISPLCSPCRSLPVRSSRVVHPRLGVCWLAAQANCRLESRCGSF